MRLSQWATAAARVAAPRSKPKRMTSAIRNKIVRDLNKKGLDGNGRFRKIGEALNVAAKVLEKHGVQVGDIMSADLFLGSKGQRSFNLEWVNEDDSFSPEQIANSMLAVSWYKLDSGQYEVLMYLS